jgi:ankyrin repeat protein
MDLQSEIRYKMTLQMLLDAETDKLTLDKLENYIEKGANINYSYWKSSKLARSVHRQYDTCFHDRYTVLTFACKNGHLDIIKYILNNCDIDQFRSGRFFSFAIQKNHFKIVKYLFENMKISLDYYIERSQYEEYDEYPITPLCEACKYGHLKIVKYLLEKKADINRSTQIYDVETPLWWAAIGGHIDVVKYLTKRLCNIDNVDKYNRTILQTLESKLEKNNHKKCWKDHKNSLHLRPKQLQIATTYSNKPEWYNNRKIIESNQLEILKYLKGLKRRSLFLKNESKLPMDVLNIIK